MRTALRLGRVVEAVAIEPLYYKLVLSRVNVCRMNCSLWKAGLQQLQTLGTGRLRKSMTYLPAGHSEQPAGLWLANSQGGREKRKLSLVVRSIKVDLPTSTVMAT
jgi:hypothetical protein